MRIILYRRSIQVFLQSLLEDCERCSRVGLRRSKGSNVNKAFNVGIIITSISDNKSTIRVSNKNYRSANEVNCTLYRSDIVCCRMQRKFYGNNLMSSVL